MTIAACPKCKNQMDLTGLSPGQLFDCPHCQARLNIPGREPPSPPLQTTSKFDFSDSPYAAPTGIGHDTRPRRRLMRPYLTIVKWMMAGGGAVYILLAAHCLISLVRMRMDAKTGPFMQEYGVGFFMLSMVCPTFYLSAYMGVLGVAYYVLKKG